MTDSFSGSFLTGAAGVELTQELTSAGWCVTVSQASGTLGSSKTSITKTIKHSDIVTIRIRNDNIQMIVMIKITNIDRV
jgi:hypothetical protein